MAKMEKKAFRVNKARKEKVEPMEKVSSSDIPKMRTGMG